MTVENRDEKESDDDTASAGEDVVSLAKMLGNISEACRRLGVDRSVYYRCLHRAQGKKSSSSHAAHKDIHRLVLELCLEYADWGCDKLSLYLTLKGTPISSPTVQKILIQHGLGRYSQRAAANKPDFRNDAAS